MIVNSTSATFLSITRSKISDYAAFTKARLTILVVVSAVIGYAIGAPHYSWLEVLWLSISGYLIAGSSTGFNQIIEKDIDKLMKRTENRPLPTGRMSVVEGLLLGIVMSLVGLVILFFVFNPLSAVLGALALFSYVLLYTPLKKYTSWAVFVGAFPGAIPPMLGYVAATGVFDLFAGLLFAIQFVWQFPHFWAIAWVADEDYQKAGYRLLPSKGGKNLQSAFLTLIYTLFLVPVALLPWAFNLMGDFAAWCAAVAGILFAVPALKLYFKRTDKAAKMLMFASFLYLPIVQIIFLVDKL